MNKSIKETQTLAESLGFTLVIGEKDYSLTVVENNITMPVHNNVELKEIKEYLDSVKKNREDENKENNSNQ